ncbi:MAG: hypothetical protein QOF40_2375 [Actinomycetota bacterium]|jgi:hypothetical protein|nr:hypothetical protein [Actinomycetota bacterium]
MDTADGIDAVHTESPSGNATPSPPLRRSRVGIVMVAIGMLLVLASIPIVVIGFGTQSEASDERALATAARDDRRSQEAHRLKLAQERIKLESIVSTIQIKAMALGTGIFQLGTAQGHIREVANHAATVFNTGDAAGAVAVWSTDGQTALDDLTQKDAAARKLMHDTEALLQQLKETP